jgi:hypothetical protein
MNHDKFMDMIREEFKDSPHPWYGPCDGFRSDGSCSECHYSESTRRPYFWMWLGGLLERNHYERRWKINVYGQRNS